MSWHCGHNTRECRLRYLKDNGKTVYEMLQDIYLTYGFSKEKGISVVRKGKSGAEEIEAMMKNFSLSSFPAECFLLQSFLSYRPKRKSLYMDKGRNGCLEW